MANKGIGKAKHQHAAKKKAAPKKKKKGGSPVHYVHTKPSKFKPKGIRKGAARIVDGDLRQLIKGIQNDMSGVRRDRNYGTKKAEDLYTRAAGDLGYIRGEVADAMGANNKKIDDAYTATGGKLQQLQQALQGEMSQTSDTNKQAAMDEMSRLGIQQTGTGRFDADASFAQQLAQQSGANNNANNELAKTMSGEIGQMLLSMNEGQYQGNMGQAINTKNSSIADITHTANEALMDLTGDISEARAGRGSAIAKMYQQMRADRFNEWSTTRDMNFSQRLQAMQFNQSEAQRRRENAMAAAAARRAARSSSGGGGGGPTSYSSSGSGAGSYKPPTYHKPKHRNPLDVLVPKKKKKLKDYFGSHYSPSGKFLDFR